MILDMLTADELDQLHRKLVTGTIRLADLFIAGCQADMTRTSGWFTGSPEHAVLKAALAEQDELTREVFTELLARWDESSWDRHVAGAIAVAREIPGA